MLVVHFLLPNLAWTLFRQIIKKSYFSILSRKRICSGGKSLAKKFRSSFRKSGARSARTARNKDLDDDSQESEVDNEVLMVRIIFLLIMFTRAFLITYIFITLSFDSIFQLLEVDLCFFKLCKSITFVFKSTFYFNISWFVKSWNHGTN